MTEDELIFVSDTRVRTDRVRGRGKSGSDAFAEQTMAFISEFIEEMPHGTTITVPFIEKAYYAKGGKKSSRKIREDIIWEFKNLCPRILELRSYLEEYIKK